MTKRGYRRGLLLVALALLGGCFGELSNAPFLPGEGRVSGLLDGDIAVDRAWVAVVGAPRLSAAVATDGSFVLDAVPSGEIELAASTGAGRAARRSLMVLSGVDNDVRLATEVGAILSGRATLLGDDLARRVTLQLLELPVTAKSETDGSFVVGSLPSGCYTLRAEHLSHQTQELQRCLQAGGETEALLSLPSLAPGDGEPGAACAPCSSRADCASGDCVTHQVRDQPEQVCAESCDSDDSCPSGFECESLDSGARACLPREVSCAALANLGAPCGSGMSCGFDIEDGVCAAGICAIPCEHDHHCPAGTQCHGASAEVDGLCE